MSALVLDVLMGSGLVVDAVMLVVWPLTVALGIVIALAALVLEPATTKVALGDMVA